MKSPENREYFSALQLLKKLLDRKSFIIKVVFIAFVFGLSMAFLANTVYQAQTIFTVHYSSESADSGIGGLANLAGVSLGSFNETAKVPTQLYDKLIRSVQFRKKLIETKIDIEGYNDISFEDYFLYKYEPSLLEKIKAYTLGLPSKIKVLLAGESSAPSEYNEIIGVSSDEDILFKLLEDKLSIDINNLDGYIRLSFEMSEAKASAQMLKNTKDLLEKSVIGFEIQSAQNQLTFIQKQYNEKRGDFELAQIRLAEYLDENLFISSASLRIEQDRLEADKDLKYNLFLESAKQLEQAKVKVENNTPVFASIQEVSIPYERIKPRRTFTALIFTILGAILALIIVILTEPYRALKSYLKT